MAGLTTVADARHIVWDWNGTLLDDNHAVVAAVNTVCGHYGRDHVDLDQWRAVFDRPLLRTYEEVLGRSLDERDWAHIDAVYHEAYRELLHTCGLADGVPTVLHEWARAGRTQSLLSMWFHEELVPLVSEFGLDPLMQRVDGLRPGTVGGGSKAEHLERHLADLRLDPSEVVLVGDVADDANAAARVGADCVLVTTGVMPRGKLRATGFPVVDSVSEAVEELSSRDRAA